MWLELQELKDTCEDLGSHSNKNNQDYEIRLQQIQTKMSLTMKLEFTELIKEHVDSKFSQLKESQKSEFNE